MSDKNTLIVTQKKSPIGRQSDQKKTLIGLGLNKIGRSKILNDDKLEKRWSQKYPKSLGLFYSAMTQRLDLKPQEDEYILMGMAAYGKPIYKQKIYDDFIESTEPFRLKQNLHRGLSEWEPNADVMDIAASIQEVTEECLAQLWTKASKYGSRNLVYAGGVALNCAANRKLANLGLFDNVWIIPNPGDAGSSLGCIAASEKKHLNWQHPFLGHNIEGEYPVDALIKELKENKMVGVANGRAEFGPRALGNRSLLVCLLYTSPSPRDLSTSRMPSSA